MSAARPPEGARPLRLRRGETQDAKRTSLGEDVCLHCGLCAERCPTGAWDMQKTLIDMAQAGGCPK